MEVITQMLLDGDNTMSHGVRMSSHSISQWASNTAVARGWEVEKVGSQLGITSRKREQGVEVECGRLVSDYAGGLLDSSR